MNPFLFAPFSYKLLKSLKLIKNLSLKTER